MLTMMRHAETILIVFIMLYGSRSVTAGRLPYEDSTEQESGSKEEDALTPFSVASSRSDPLALQDWIDQLSYTHHARNLRHTVPTIYTPRSCEYDSFNHDVTSNNPIDQITCPDLCGFRKTFTFRVTTICDGPYVNGVDCNSVADCYVVGCTDDCDSSAGGCPCPSFIDLLLDVQSVCLPLCSLPTQAPSQAPSEAPTLFGCGVIDKLFGGLL